METKASNTDVTEVTLTASNDFQDIRIESAKRYDALGLDNFGCLTLETAGSGGYGDCDHRAYIRIDFKQASLLRDFLNDSIIKFHDGCEHLLRQEHEDEDFSCHECGYGT